jgi:monoamine oxidase
MERFDTIVVGAGIAGLTTARLLASTGRRVVVLEARDRTGGRVTSRRGPAGTIDLGASWIHGIDGSPAAAAAHAFGMRTVEFTVGGYQVDSRPIAYHGPSGERLSPERTAEFVADVHAVDDALVDVVARSSRQATYRDVCAEAIRASRLTGDRAERVREHLAHRSEEQYGADAGDLAAHGLDDDAIDGDEVVFPDGYDVLATRLADGLDVRLETPVRRVVRSPGGVVVDDAFAADDAVVTVPVGVLRTLEFYPPLPPSHTGPLDRLRMNAFEKVFLRFPARFWEDDVSAIRQLGPEGRWWHSWYDVGRADGSATLLTFAAGSCARAIRGWDAQRVGASVLEQLRRVYGDAVPDPVEVTVTAWQDDPWARGSYAYMLPGSRTEDHDALAEPVDGVLHIAGEATWTDDPATVAGAMLSGHRAAERVLGRAVPIEDAWV